MTDVKMYKIWDKGTGEFLEGGVYGHRSATGKTWKKKAHAKASLTNMKQTWGKLRPKFFKDLETVEYSLVETNREPVCNE